MTIRYWIQLPFILALVEVRSLHTIKSQVSYRAYKSVLLMSDETNDNDKIRNYKKKLYAVTPEERKKIIEKNKFRSVDYPSFCYDTDNRSRKVCLSYKCQEEANSTAIDRNNERNITITNNDSKNIFDRLFSASPISLIDLQNENRRTRLVENRAYSKMDFTNDDILRNPPTLTDLSPPPTNLKDTFWISIPARALTFFGSYFSFPYIVRFLESFVSIELSSLDDIASKFAPGVSILYGTFVSLTLSILYSRQQSIQENAAKESSLISLSTRSLLGIFKNDPSSAVQAGQCAADQIRTLSKGSRGAELMLLMYNDPYARMLELLDQMDPPTSIVQDQISDCKSTIRTLYQLRADRLSDEALALPRTHFFILTSLTALILIGYTISTLPTFNEDVSNESSILFGLLCSIYVLFYDFARDLNDPFGGIYQIRRSATASHLLQTKWLIVNHPILRDQVDFREVEDDGSNNILMRTPGLGDMWFKKYDIYP